MFARVFTCAGSIHVFAELLTVNDAGISRFFETERVLASSNSLCVQSGQRLRSWVFRRLEQQENKNLNKCRRDWFGVLIQVWSKFSSLSCLKNSRFARQICIVRFVLSGVCYLKFECYSKDAGYSKKNSLVCFSRLPEMYVTKIIRLTKRCCTKATRHTYIDKLANAIYSFLVHSFFTYFMYFPVISPIIYSEFSTIQEASRGRCKRKNVPVKY